MGSPAQASLAGIPVLFMAGPGIPVLFMAGGYDPLAEVERRICTVRKKRHFHLHAHQPHFDQSRYGCVHSPGSSSFLFEVAFALSIVWLIFFWMMRRNIYVRPEARRCRAAGSTPTVRFHSA